jgi:diacylglycerol kinase (ATP)
MLDIRKVVRSFRYAGRGLVELFLYENNAKVHVLAAVAVVGLGLWVRLSRLEWAVLMMQIGLVFAAEGFNTAIEKLADRVTTEPDPLIRAAKDLAAGAVLAVAIMAVVVAGLIFVPKFYGRWILDAGF